MKDDLRFDLQLFAEEGEGEEGTKEGTKEGEKNTEDDFYTKIEGMISKEDVSSETYKKVIDLLVGDSKKFRQIAGERLREIMEKKAKEKERQKKDEGEKQKAKEEKEQFKELYDDVKPKFDKLVDDLEKTQSFFEGELNKKIQSLPAEYHDLIPEGIDIRDKIKWIETFISKLPQKEEKGTSQKGTQSVNTSGSGPQGEGTGKEVEASKEKIAQQIQATKNPKELETLLKKLGRRV